MAWIVVEREVDAPPEVLWDVVVDVVSWPRWTASMTSVDLLDGEVALGRRARVRQPRLPTQVWTVTELEPGRSFSWAVANAAVTTVGGHEVYARDHGTSRIVLTLDQSGPLAPVVGLLLGSLSRRYVELEAAGLKAAAESRRAG
ncbi:SRPBCC family protein [Actinomycetospora atypica]|uniref:SRPBCC family protein n=1 Tax=Actinomycetospora atypica TaxID=1290095 RepID=A0ABV9YT25_9PSEU